MFQTGSYGAPKHFLKLSFKIVLTYYDFYYYLLSPYFTSVK